MKYNRWQQGNRPIIHNVTSVKYNKENEVFSHELTFPKLNKNVQKQEKNALISSTSFQNYHFLIILLDTKTELTLVMSVYNCTESVPLLRCHYCKVQCIQQEWEITTNPYLLSSGCIQIWHFSEICITGCENIPPFLDILSAE